MSEPNKMPFSNMPRPVMTVTGPVPHEELGITDGHNHLWISRVPGAEQGSPVLDQYDSIRDELIQYRQAGGGALLDCQPGGFGRDARQLEALSRAAGVSVVACTGFHRRRYAPGLDALWAGSPKDIANRFVGELTQGTEETLGTRAPVLAGFIKIALEAEWDQSPRNCIEAAAEAARQTGVLIEIHTEKGELAERACTFFQSAGLSPRQLVMCHMDKRPDAGLHKALADTGVALEYDTFHRPKYDPAARLWPLLEHMVAGGYADRVVLATDMAEAQQYRSIGGGPGLASLPAEIKTQLAQKGISESEQQQLLGGNIARRLAGLN
jgi:predicted metal-dependent phosphotriesterase family hydrolase